jgi:hypothetical protein
MDAAERLTRLLQHFEQAEVIQFFRAINATNITQENKEYSIQHDSEFFEVPYFCGNIKLKDEENLPLFIIKALKPITERSGKKAQYELAKNILKAEARYIAGIFIFYDDKNDFRLSLVYSVPQATGKRDWSNFRRYTYFVSKDQTNKTFLQQISQADFSSIEKLKEAFSVEKVTKEFYQEIANWYFWAMDIVEFPDDEDKDRNSRNAKNLIRMITRIIFIWFMKEKRLIPAELFEKSAVDNLLNYNDKTGSTYYKAILQNLFFATLNTPMRKDNPKSRIFIEDAKSNGFINDGYLQQGYYRYSRFIKNKDIFLEKFKNIPFLNGGLFESLDKKIDDREIRIDCFSDNPKNEGKLKVPDYLFFGGNDLSNIPSDNGQQKKKRGLIDILKNYNFTTDENTPIDEEVALDPELLGKVFENLLASYNPETATTARKATGSYYTPREIVDYMVTESLVQHFSKLFDYDEKYIKKLNQLFSYSYETNPFDNDEEINTIIEAIDKIKILDPACGSGAFPMGILHKLVQALHKIDPDNQQWKKSLLNKVPAELKEEVENSLKNKSLDYIRKLGLIEHCIFGVDIQEIAIQISKLRFFISLLIEQEVDDSKENRDIRALPNLETKFVAANTLIGLGDSQFLKSQEVINLEEKLFNVREKIFYTNSRAEKHELQNQLNKLRHQLKTELAKVGFPNDKAEKITQWDPFDQNTHADWFDLEWMFGVETGFDIVIGNPPYIQLQKSVDKDNKNKFADLYKNQNYKTFDRMGDIYCLFYEKGINLLCEDGHLAFITSNKWMRAGYGEKLRQLFSAYNPKILIDLGPGVFENAIVDTNILILQKAKNQHKLQAVTLNEKKKDEIDFSAMLEQKGVILKNLTSDTWFIGSDAEQRLKEKIERIGKPLKDWDVNIYYGIKTGLNEAFIINDEKRQEILDNCKDETERQRTEAIIKPILRGRDIKRYHYEWAGLWVIVIPAGWTNENRGNLNPEIFVEKTLPSLMKHLAKFKEKAQKRDDQGDYWWELRACAYYSEFEKEKVVWASVGETYYCFVDGNYLVLDTNYFTTSLKKWQIGILNSKIIIPYINSLDTLVGTIAYRHYKYNFEKITIPAITPATEPIVKQIELLVDKILAAKKGNPQADTGEWEREIDRLVYRLYDLTEEEIRIIEKQK